MTSKKTLLLNLKYNVLVLKQGTIYERDLLRGIETLNDIKHDLQHGANMVQCIMEQIDRHVQWYHGERYFYSKQEIDGMWEAINKVANALGYEVYSPNGAWFLRNITK